MKTARRGRKIEKSELATARAASNFPDTVWVGTSRNGGFDAGGEECNEENPAVEGRV